MAGYIGKSQGVTQVDGYNRTEADDRYVNASGDTMTGDLNGRSFITADDTNNYALVAGRYSAGYGGAVINTTSNASFLELQVNGFGGLRADSAGRVTMPYQPAAFGKFTSITSTATNYVVGISDVTSRGGMVVSSNRITVPVSGYYLVYANQLISTSGSNYLHIRVNGATNTYAYVNVDDTEDEAVQAIVSLSANDYIDFYMTNTSYTWTGSHSSWFVTLLG